MTTYVFGAACDTMVAGIYTFDSFVVAATTPDDAWDALDRASPWADVSTSIVDLVGTGSDLAQDDRTVREILWERHREEE